MVDLSDKLRLLGDPTRWRILEFLAQPVQSCCSREDGVCACDLETFLGVTQPTISHHMKLLADAGLVTAERRGRWVYYELEPAAFRELASSLEGLARAAERARMTAEPA
jgi:ArsR family transcriptional regulator